MLGNLDHKQERCSIMGKEQMRLLGPLFVITIVEGKKTLISPKH
jgi:hypothetical protein